MVRGLIRRAMGVESALCEAGDTRQDFVRGLGPDEGLGFGVVGIDELSDRLLEFGDAAVTATTNLLLGQLTKPALNEIEPRAVGRGKWTWKRGRLANQLRMIAVLW